MRRGVEKKKSALAYSAEQRWPDDSGPGNSALLFSANRAATESKPGCPLRSLSMKSFCNSGELCRSSSLTAGTEGS